MSLTGEVDRPVHVHHGNIRLFAAPVVKWVDDDTIDSAGLNLLRDHVTLSVKSQDRHPVVEMNVLSVQGYEII